MKVTEIVVSVGRTCPHPTRTYSNFRPHLSLKATLNEGDDLAAAVKTLQAQAEQLVEDHKNIMLRQMIQLEEMEQQDAEISTLERRIRDAQRDLEMLRDQDVPDAMPAITREAEPASGEKAES